MNHSLRDKYTDYLEAQHIPVERRSAMEDLIFAELPAFIRRYFDPTFSGIEERNDPGFFEGIRERVFTTPDAKSENDAIDGKFTLALRQWSRFLSTLRSGRKAQLTDAEKISKRKGKATQNTVSQISDPLCPDDNDTQTEGKLIQVSTTRHERNRSLREACLRYYAEELRMPYTCVVCGMSFERVYGEIGKDYIEVHHLIPISSTAEEHDVDPRKDLVPLCSNCHSMIHRGGSDGMPMTLDELKNIFTSRKKP